MRFCSIRLDLRQRYGHSGSVDEFAVVHEQPSTGDVRIDMETVDPTGVKPWMHAGYAWRPLLATDRPPAPPTVRKALITIDIHITEIIDRARLLPKGSLKTQDNSQRLSDRGFARAAEPPLQTSRSNQQTPRSSGNLSIVCPSATGWL
jgi:hypothetical protein